MASVVEMTGLPVDCRVGELSSVSTAMDTPFSFMPSRQTKGAVSAESFCFVLASGVLAEMLFSAAKATDL